MPTVTPITVAQLIERLQLFDPKLLVVYKCHSEQVLMELEMIELWTGCRPRLDGWVHDARPDKPSMQYLLFPGN